MLAGPGSAIKVRRGEKTKINNNYMRKLHQQRKGEREMRQKRTKMRKNLLKRRADGQILTGRGRSKSGGRGLKRKTGKEN